MAWPALPHPLLWLSTAFLLIAFISYSLSACEVALFFFSARKEATVSLFGVARTYHQKLNLTVHLHPEDHENRENATVFLDWTIAKQMRYPDGFPKTVYTVNGEFPCPNIEARSGDRIIINVHNQLDDVGLALHFHGLRMEGFNHMDGAVGITQSPILAGGNFTYDFTISHSQSGTFWWHAHSELMRADGLFGAFIIHSPSDEFYTTAKRRLADHTNEDLLLLVGDWYHESAANVQKKYDTWKHWGMEPTPDSLLVNGMGSFNCSKLSVERRHGCVSVSKPVLFPQKRTSKLRIINAGSMSGFSIRIPGNRITVLSVDGGNHVQRQNQSWSTVGILYPGERVDVLVDWTMKGGDYAMVEIILDKEYYRWMNVALTPVQQFPVRIRGWESEDGPEFQASTTSHQELNESMYDLSVVLGPDTDVEPYLITEPDQIILVYTNIEILAHLENRPKGYINHTFWELPATPLISTPRDQWDIHQLVPYIHSATEKDTWVDIVINNLDEVGHPFHLHGYNFYIVARFKADTRLGWRAFTYNPYDKQSPRGGPYNTKNPVQKDTVYVPAAGYVVLRIKADNLGIWFLHCHILWHQSVGMAMAIEVGK